MTESCGVADPYLSGGFQPIPMESDYADLSIDGELPLSLNGSYYRIGPNPQFPPRVPYNPLGGDGMVHAFHFRDGQVSYRNRWVRTQQWQLEREAGRALFGTSGNPADSDPGVAGLATDGVANTNLVWHAGKLLEKSAQSTVAVRIPGQGHPCSGETTSCGCGPNDEFHLPDERHQCGLC